MTSLKFETKPIEIKRVDNITGSLFSTHYKNKTPVILTGIMQDWLPMETWTREYIEGVLYEEFGDEVTVLKSNDNKHFIDHYEISEKVEITFKNFMDSVFHPKQCTDDEPVKYYLRTHSMPSKLYEDLIIQKQVKRLLTAIHHAKSNNVISSKSQQENPSKMSSTFSSTVQDVHPWEEFLEFGEEECVEPEVLHEEMQTSLYPGWGNNNGNVPVDLPMPFQEMFRKVFKPETMQLWVGTMGNVTPLHFDRNHGLLVQFIGCKELILFSHTDTSFLYPYPSHTSRSHTSKVNLRDLDTCLERFPRLWHAQRYTCVLHPGEILYTPPFWWHDVTSLDGCVSVTLPWDITLDEVPLNMLM
ncbi:uncharacterized protein LOC117110513 [Anneissia japonica]|uniref:uncharacterized protein LOC117110513 n=1 Tax=Anneissia japonica TaxID=1529436 RepID=UPI001425B15B|nr:uncharacterized protein LOC117110513 [Anneissia japonica]XP_033109155.1 uncharacterized protein LOC117110513 [Anneissia japonica]XP_033109156.1 uncharacterized protein LOC117110513 [Anneissia japonica]